MQNYLPLAGLAFDPAALGLNALVPYYSMFPVSFPLKHLSQAEAGEWVLDPFCGRGTTNYAARLLGLPTVAVDCNPVAVAITEAKMADVGPDLIVAECRAILSAGAGPRNVPQGEFWDWAYHSETLQDICRVREALLDDYCAPARKALRGIMLGALHGPRNKGEPSYLSNQMPRTYATKPKPAVRYWKERDLKPARVNLLNVVSRRARHAYGLIPPAVENRVILGDSRDLNSYGLTQRFAWVVTSPPYPGMRTYYPDQWLRNWFLGGKDDVEYIADGQIGRFTREEYVEGLAQAWRSIAAVCRPKARMVIRFGALSSAKCEPLDVLSETLTRAHCGWRIVSTESAGSPKDGRRQARQFNARVRQPIEEIDVVAILE